MISRLTILQSSAAVIKTGRAALLSCIVATACHATAIVAVAAGTPAVSAAARVQIKFVPATQNATDQIVVTGLPAEELARFKQLGTSQKKLAFSLVVERKTATQTSTPMLGNYKSGPATIVFQPRFPLRQGVSYTATWNPATGAAIEHTFAIEQKDKTPPQVTQVFPTGDVLPENQLKFYIHFSKPMQQGEAYKHIQLIETKTGKQVETPFLELKEELWDPSGKRFTLYFDPGRIKRGLQPRELFGPTLEAGKEYALVINQTWKDASASKPLAKPFRKTFKASEPDQTTPNHRNWKITAPIGGSTDPLRVQLDEPLDHAMLSRVIQAETPGGKPIAGRADIQDGETIWVFTPTQPWSAGIHTLKIATTLEDRAGNSIGRPFEVDVVRENTRRVIEETATLRFRIK